MSFGRCISNRNRHEKRERKGKGGKGAGFGGDGGQHKSGQESKKERKKQWETVFYNTVSFQDISMNLTETFTIFFE